MTIHMDDEQLTLQKFSVGQPVLRSEDPKLVRGEGIYTDDVNLPGQAYAAMARSHYAHGLIKSIDVSTAKSMPGVLAVYTADDLNAYGPYPYRIAMNSRDGSPVLKPKRFALASTKVTYVGDPIACVIALTAAQAQDAAEAIGLEIEPLKPVLTMQEAVAPDAPQILDDVPGNVALDYHFGDSAKVEEAFASAAHVTKMFMTVARVVVNAMEPRACVGSYDEKTGRYTMYAPTQGVHGSKVFLAEMLGVAPDHVHFIANNVGGSFGLKGSMFAEYICALHGARALNRPVKWTDTRSGSFLSDHHGRDQEHLCELALDKDGHFLAIRCTGFGNLGGQMTMIGPLFSSFNIVKHVNGAYRTPLIEVSTRCVFTNMVPITAYRGAGRPEGNYYMERLIDMAAAEMGIDPADMRRRNHIQPDSMPCKTPSGSTYDSGNFPAILSKALDLADWNGFAARQKDSAHKGKLRGRGIGQFVEVTAPVSGELGKITFNKDGTVTLFTGSHDHGQGHATTFGQILSTQLGIPFDKIKLMQVDSDQLRMGTGTGGSKSLMCSGTAIAEASDLVIEKGKQVASHLLETAMADITFAKGRFAVAGTDRSISIMEMAQKLNQGVSMPQDAPASLDIDHVSSAKPATFPNGCHICEVEIDPETGVVEIAKYTMVGDFGVVVNPIIVAGQVQGGVVQGIGECLMENTVYDEHGQLLSGSFMDYAMPRASDVPNFVYADLPTRATTNPLGVKGCGEAGCAGSLTSIMNAIVDGLSVYGIRHIDMPATPHRVWQAIEKAKQAHSSAA